MTRVLFLIAALGAAGCSGTPESLGITGPGAPPPQPQPRDDLSPAGIPDPGSSYGPSYGPIPSNGPYFNYN
jgi:hypothetical protein